MSTSKAGLIGLGAMGTGMAKQLLAAGFDTAGCDVNPKSVENFVAHGGRAAATPADAARDAEVLVVMVVNAQQAEAVLFGENGATSTLPRGSAVLLCSTVPASSARAIAARLNETGHPMIDAPVSGGVVGAESGKLTIMASGPDAAFDKAARALDAMAGKVYRLGPEAGTGSSVKTVNQLLAGVHIAAAAEAMALGTRAGADPRVLYEVISNSAGNSWMFTNRVPHMLDGDYTPLSAVNIFVKDLGMVLDTGRELKFPLPIAAVAHQMFLMASAAGWGGLDDSAVVKVFEEMAGISVSGDKG